MFEIILPGGLKSRMGNIWLLLLKRKIPTLLLWKHYTVLYSNSLELHSLCPTPERNEWFDQIGQFGRNSYACITQSLSPSSWAPIIEHWFLLLTHAHGPRKAYLSVALATSVWLNLPNSGVQHEKAVFHLHISHVLLPNQYILKHLIAEDI